jgi:hypothetical protein
MKLDDAQKAAVIKWIGEGLKLADIQKRPNYASEWLAGGFDAASVVGFMPWGGSLYNGLALQLNRRFAHGFQMQGAYTWSHNRDNGTATHFSTVLSPRRPQDFRDLNAEWADSALDRRHRFTMNWMFTRPLMPVRFEKGEPFCHFFPVKRGELESYTPRLRNLSDEPELARRQRAWKESRKHFIDDLQRPGSPAQDEQWQRHYFRGQDVADGSDAATDHRTRLRLKPFER